MSIETLLEAARFLEWQAQQTAREENEKHEKLRLEREQEQKKAGKTSVPRANNAIAPEEPRSELLVPISPPAPAPPPPLPLAAPISVIPIPVVTSPPQQAAQTTLSPPLVQRHQPLVSTPGVTKEASSVAPVIQRPPGPLLPDGKAATPPSGSPKQLQHYAAPVLAISQHHVVQQPLQPQPLQHPGAPPPLGALKLAPAEDTKPNEQKKRPGGVGTREVHNKLEKNRRAHLKECFETLKRNIPNVDDKKTSNLSVLRSALRYIQTLKRKEKEYEHEMERLAREKIATQQRLAELKNELSQWMDILEIDRIIRQTVQPEDDQASTSTASGAAAAPGSPRRSPPGRAAEPGSPVLGTPCSVCESPWGERNHCQRAAWIALTIRHRHESKVLLQGTSRCCNTGVRFGSGRTSMEGSGRAHNCIQALKAAP